MLWNQSPFPPCRSQGASSRFTCLLVFSVSRMLCYWGRGAHSLPASVFKTEERVQMESWRDSRPESWISKNVLFTMIYAYPRDPIHFLRRGVNRRLLKIQSDLVASLTWPWGCRELCKLPFGNVDLTPHKKHRSWEEQCVFRQVTEWQECKVGQLANIF